MAKDDSSFDRDAVDRPHAVVIGAGFGGLAAAVRLGARGYRVTVLEKLDAPGGRAYVFREGGYVFDAGPTIITAPFLLEELWTLAGRRIEDDIKLEEIDPFYGIRFDEARSSIARATPKPCGPKSPNSHPRTWRVMSASS